MPNTLSIKIAGLTICIQADSPNDLPAVPAAYLPFMTDGKISIQLRLHPGPLHLPRLKTIFTSPPIWSLSRYHDLFIVKVFEQLDVPGSTLTFSPQLENADLYSQEPGASVPNPFDGPLMELLLIHYLALGRGAVIHSCGIERHGAGLLFVGESGAGKSTLARLWNQKPDARVLSDDRTIVRRRGNKFQMFGTPWHGEARFGTPAGVPLAHIFFLRQQKRNRLLTLGKAEAVRRLLTCCFPPFWSVAGMEFTMDFFNKMVDATPCHELQFLPDGSVTDMIKRDF